MNAHNNTLEQSSASSSRFTTVWLVVLMVVAGLTAIVTAVLVGWPLIAYIASRLFAGS